MGLGEFKTRSNAKRLRVGMGTDDKGRPRAVIAVRSTEGAPGAVQVFKASGEAALDKDGNTVWRREYEDISGKVVKIERNSTEYNGKDIHTLDITIADGLDLYVLQLDRGDEYWGDFAQRAPGVDWSKPVRFAPYSIPREHNPEKRDRLLVVYQDGNKVERFFKKDDPNGPPKPVFDEDEKKWLWGKRNNWLDNGPVEEAIKTVTYMSEAGSVPGAGENFDDIV